MNVSTAKTVRELALEIPNATRVFEKLGIDYCCGGGKSLEEACREASLPVQQVLNTLEGAAQAPASPVQQDWSAGPVAGLIHHIIETHHKYTREEIARLQPLLQKVCSVHQPKHPELLSIQETFQGLVQELSLHMMKEEAVLFPYIVRVEAAFLRKEPISPGPFGTVQKPVQVMVQEHESAGDALREIRKASRDYALPADACFSYQTLYQVLQTFEADLHQHIHLENNILFPRAVQMESAAQK